MSIYQATRSGTLVNLFHNAGHSTSYSVLTQFWQRVHWSKTLKNFQFHPIFLKSIQFAADNIDITEEILDRKGTCYATQTVAFQRGEPTGQSEQQLPLGKRGSSKHRRSYKSSIMHSKPLLVQYLDLVLMFTWKSINHIQS